MTSYFEIHGRLRTATVQAYDRFYDRRSTFEDRLLFYTLYLKDVVPDGVSVCHVSNYVQAFDLMPDDYPRFRREEIQLRCAEGILMTGLVSMEHYTESVSQIAATVAYEHWRDGLVVRRDRQAWGMFTCRHEIRFYKSRNARDYTGVDNFDPLNDCDYVAAYIQEEYDKIRRH